MYSFFEMADKNNGMCAIIFTKKLSSIIVLFIRLLKFYTLVCLTIDLILILKKNCFIPVKIYVYYTVDISIRMFLYKFKNHPFHFLFENLDTDNIESENLLYLFFIYCTVYKMYTLYKCTKCMFISDKSSRLGFLSKMTYQIHKSVKCKLIELIILARTR